MFLSTFAHLIVQVHKIIAGKAMFVLHRTASLLYIIADSFHPLCIKRNQNVDRCGTMLPCSRSTEPPQLHKHPALSYFHACEKYPRNAFQRGCVVRSRTAFATLAAREADRCRRSQIRVRRNRASLVPAAPAWKLSRRRAMPRTIAQRFPGIPT